MALPTLKEVLNQYLYGRNNTPSDLTDEELFDRLMERENETINVNVSEFMADVGRFVNAKSFDWLKYFFNDETLYDQPILLSVRLANLYPNVNPEKGYTKTEILTAMGYYNSDELATKTVYQFLYRDEKESDDDYADRSFIWGTTEFMVAGSPRTEDEENKGMFVDLDREETKGPRFIIYPGGRREIKGFAIVPKAKKDADDNFDFYGGLISDLTNQASQGVIDPCSIGKTVNFEFQGDMPTCTLTQEDYFATPAIETSIFSNMISGNALLDKLIDRLWDSGIIKFLDADNRPILYGSAGNDVINGSKIVKKIDFDKRLYDISDSEFGYLGFRLRNRLKDYVKNGIHYIGGQGDDIISGTDGNDVIKGGAGSDYLSGSKGDDKLHGGDGVDWLEGGENNDRLYGGEGEDTLYGGSGDDILYGGTQENPDDNKVDHLHGGTGFDTFHVDSHDVIYLNDKSENGGQIYLYDKNGVGNLLSEGRRSEDDEEGVYKDSYGNIYRFDGDDLVINGTLRIKNFKKFSDTQEVDGETIYSALGISLVVRDDKNDEKPGLDRAEGEISPIIIDLNGNGIETRGPGETYFDHDGDALKELTGWVSGGDGLLVRDLNGDGVINNGTELFGNNTLLSNGKKAKNGYEALAELDDNGDGIIDANDSAWSSLSVWKDANGNGITDDGELISLADAGIASIGTRYRNSSYIDAGGNSHKQTGSVTLTDGSKVTSSDVWFNVDETDRINSGEIAIGEDISILPNATGFGKVHDLRQAMALDDGLVTLLNNYLAETDSVKQSELLDELIYRWTGVAEIELTQHYAINSRQVAVIERLSADIYNNKYNGSYIMEDASKVLLNEYSEFKLFIEAQIKIQTQYRDELSGLVLTVFNSDVSEVILNKDNIAACFERLYDDNQCEKINELAQLLRSLTCYSPGGRKMLSALFSDCLIAYPEMAEFLATRGHDGDQSMIALPEGSELYGLGGDDNLYGGDGNDVLVGGKGNDYLEGGEGNDVYLFSRGDGRDTIYNGERIWTGLKLTEHTDTLRFLGDIKPEDVTIYREGGDLVIDIKNSLDQVRVDYHFYDKDYQIGRIEFSDGTVWLPAHISELVLAGSELNQTLYAYDDGSEIHAGGGDDILEGGRGDDKLYGDDGDDYISGGYGNDIIYGGKGNDCSYGGKGSDVYIFNSGDGQDFISCYGNGSNDSDVLQLGEGINPEEVSFSSGEHGLTLHFGDSGDSVTISDYMKFGEIHFSDGTVWTKDNITQMVELPVHDEVVIPTDSDGEIIWGSRINDILTGGAGDDQIYGKQGDDTLRGGSGNDYLSGGEGSDIYLFGSGDGHDIINNYDSGENKYDVLKLGEGITADNVTISGNENGDLILSIGDGEDSITIEAFFLARYYRIDEVHFADGTIWQSAQIVAMFSQGNDSDQHLYTPDSEQPLYAGGGNDIVYGSDADDMLYGEDGDDRLFGNNGDDLLVGGKGNDYMQGGEGSNTYLFNRGDGHDTIDNADVDWCYNERLIFGEGISVDDVSVACNNGHLVLNVNNGGGSVTLLNYFDPDKEYAEVTEIVFADGSVWSHEQIVAQIAAQSDDANKVYYADWLDGNVVGGGSNDTIYGGDYDDVLYGGAGDDVISGGYGDDIISGGKGNDYLYGGLDFDTYLFDIGDGNDTIFNVNYINIDDEDNYRYWDFGLGTLLFGQGIHVEDVTFSVNNNDLVLSLSNGQDSVTIKDYFILQDLDGEYIPYVQFIEFSEGYRLDYDSVIRRMRFGNDSSQVIHAGINGSELFGAGGNDTLIGHEGRDILHGETGNDALYGGLDNDILVGGIGNDYLEGGLGADTYLFNRGDGQDVINENGDSRELGEWLVTDTLRFGEGIFAEDIEVSSTDNHLILSIKGTDDRITINQYLTNDNTWMIEQILFADGTVWHVQDVMNYMEHNIPLPVSESALATPSIHLLKQMSVQFMMMGDADDAANDAGGVTQLALPQNNVSNWVSGARY